MPGRTSPESNTDIDWRSLRLGRRIGIGGQGMVYELGAPRQDLVFKQYLRPDPDGAALKGLVDLPGTLQPEERIQLANQTAWPLARVMNDNAVAGFVMQRIPARFRGRNKIGAPKARELQYLLYEPRLMWGDIAPPDITGRVELTREIAGLVQLLHSRMLVIGDISMNNLLWAYDSSAAIFLIDCDGIRRLGRRPVHPPTETPDWEDIGRPQGDQGAVRDLDLDNDRYKCALVIGRILSKDPYVRPGDRLNLMPGVPAAIGSGVQSLWQQAARPRGSRPGADRWLSVLGIK